VTNQPRYGTLTLDESTGAYTYTPDPTLVRPGITDAFTVEVSNESGAQRTGLLGALTALLHNWALSIGVAKPGTAEATVDVKVPGDGQYGNAADSRQYWVKQSFYNCQLLATAMAIGQATHSTSPTEDEMSRWAETTDSVFFPGQKMYLGDFSQSGVSTVDAVALANQYFDVTAVLKTYGGGNVYAPGQTATATAADGRQALGDLEAALARGDAAMVVYPVAVVWSTFGLSPRPNNSYTFPDHAAVVTQVDLTNGWVYVNDSSAVSPFDRNVFVGQGLAIPIGAFLNGWQTSNYMLTTFTAKQPASTNV
jgi:hypothetical protein